MLMFFKMSYKMKENYFYLSKYLYSNFFGKKIKKLEKILEKLWDSENNYVDDNTLTVYVRRLRMKIEKNPSEPQMLLTVRRMGYKWNVMN